MVLQNMSKNRLWQRNRRNPYRLFWAGHWWGQNPGGRITGWLLHALNQRNGDIWRRDYRYVPSLWRIEESFKVTKSELEARLVYVWTKEHIEAHFLTCFVALTIARILENKLERKYSIGTILESLSKAKCSLIQQNYYLFDYYDEVLKDIERVTDIDFGNVSVR